MGKKLRHGGQNPEINQNDLHSKRGGIVVDGSPSFTPIRSSSSAAGAIVMS
jgi:hypothetical protein